MNEKDLFEKYFPNCDEKFELWWIKNYDNSPEDTDSAEFETYWNNKYFAYLGWKAKN